LIEIRDLYKYYGSFAAVDGLSLSIGDGSIYGFVGPNGAGKTTTMKIMTGLLMASSGTVSVKGELVSHDSRKLREKMGYMPDFFGVYDNLTVAEYMDFYAGAYYVPYADRKGIIGNLLEVVNLTDKLGAYVDTLSRGMKQRLCLARSLVHDPEVLILDEPASGLDPRARVEIKEVLKQLKGLGKTIIISSHILTELSELCTEVGIFERGKIVASGTVRDIMLGLSGKRRIMLKPLAMSEGLVTALSEQPLVTDITENAWDIEFSFDGGDEDMARLIKTLVVNDFLIVSVREREGNLEEIFMKLTEGGKGA
jgi:ABC-2 type transport system ATP-binding protein